MSNTRASQKLSWQRDKYTKEVEQPWRGEQPNDRFAKMYQNEPAKLVNTYTGRELRRLGMPKLAKVKEAKQTT
jgi:hypothetical protein